MSSREQKENTGAWIIHHGQKVALDARGASEFPAIDEAAKAANLLCRLGESSEVTLNMETVKAVATAAGLNPRFELDGLLSILQKKKFIDRTDAEVVVLGATTRAALSQATDLFEDAKPSKYEYAAIELAELTSKAPIKRSEANEYIGDQYRLKTSQASDFIDQAEQIGFVDAEGLADDRLIFNGNLFRRQNVEKTNKVLSSLSSAEQIKMTEFGQLLAMKGCVQTSDAIDILGEALFDKLRAASVYDLNTVSNEQGEHVFITSPGAFHKFVDPLIDDTFDMAKALVAALTFGMTRSDSMRGRIDYLGALLRKLLRNESVGPAPAIGMDYKVLEERRVVQITRERSSYSMRLLKRDVGELALLVLQQGNASTDAVGLQGASMTAYKGPEESRARIRKLQTAPSKRQTLDVISVLRSGRGL